MKKISVIAFVLLTLMACGGQNGETENEMPAGSSGTNAKPMVDSLGSGTVPGSVSSGDSTGAPANAPQ